MGCWPSAAVQVCFSSLCWLRVGTEEGQSWALLFTEMDTASIVLRNQEIPDQLQLPLLQVPQGKQVDGDKQRSIVLNANGRFNEYLLNKMWHRPASHRLPLPFAVDGSPRPPGFERASVWPPAPPFRSLPWPASLCRNPAHRPPTATSFCIPQNGRPSGGTLQVSP